MKQRQIYCVLLAFFISGYYAAVRAEGPQHDGLVRQLCVGYSNAGDLVKASVVGDSFSITIAHANDETGELTGHIPDEPELFQQPGWVQACHLAISPDSSDAALAFQRKNNIVVELINLRTGKLTHSVLIPNQFPIRFSLPPIGYIKGSGALVVSQAHYLATGEPEVATSARQR